MIYGSVTNEYVKIISLHIGVSSLISYQVSAGEIESLLYDVVQNVLSRRIDWECGFGITLRRNGTVVIGDIRDTIDTGVTYGSIEVDVMGDKISIKFTNDVASYIFGHRNLIDELVIEDMLQQIGAEISLYIIGKSLGKR